MLTLQPLTSRDRRPMNGSLDNVYNYHNNNKDNSLNEQNSSNNTMHLIRPHNQFEDIHLAH